jgi:hypothetical protein
MTNKTFFFICLVFLFSCSKSTSEFSAPKVVVNTIDNVVNDMQGSHEAPPFGVPVTYTWQAGPRIGMGNDPGTFRAMLPWGQIFETAPGNTSTNTRIEIRGLKAYYLNKKTNSWQLWVGAQKPTGLYTSQDLTVKVTKPADIKTLAESISVGMLKGYNFYLLAPMRTTISPGDIGGVFITVQARLILQDDTKPDDRDAAQLMLSAGGDYWLNLTAAGDNFSNNGDIAIGKFKRLTREWRAFNMHTLTAEQIRNTPPPLE